MQYLYRAMPRATSARRRAGSFARHRRQGPWRERFVLPNGREVVLRPIEPQDAAALRDGFTTLTAEEVRFRFLHPLKEMSEDLARQLTAVDPKTGIALVVAEPLPPGQALIGAVARASLDADRRSAEFAILVARPLAGQGLGTYLMRKLIRWARNRRLQRLWGEVLLENAAMLRLADRLGFRHSYAGAESGRVRVLKDFGAAPA